MENIHLAYAEYTQSASIQKVVKADSRRRYLYFECIGGDCYVGVTDPPIVRIHLPAGKIFEPRVGMINDFYLYSPIPEVGYLLVGYESNIPIL